MAKRNGKRRDSVPNSEATVPGRNGGRLLPGGKIGHKGGPGRPRSEIRDLAAQSYAERLPKLLAIIDRARAKRTPNDDRVVISAMEALANVSGLKSQELNLGSENLDDYLRALNLERPDPEPR